MVAEVKKEVAQMAKLGNESRLILKLAQEQAGKRQDKKAGEFGDDRSKDFLAGYNRGTEEYRVSLINIALELESGNIV